MVFAVSEGKILAVHKPTYQAPTALRINDDLTMDYEAIYAQQSAVRLVVDFLARNVGQLSLHGFERVSDTDRDRLSEGPLAWVLARPNSFTTPYRMISDTVADRGIYGRALWLKTMQDGKPAVVRIPCKLWKVDTEDAAWLAPRRFIVRGSNGATTLAAEQVVYFRGYSPEDARVGMSPIESLRRVLSEEFAAGQMREQALRNGARMSGYIHRPKDAPKWDPSARDRFARGWRSQFAGHTASEGGGTPILEDGMTFVSASQTAEQLQYVEARKLTREEVAAAYFIPPPMVGMLDHATFGNITEQHKMLYQDTLGPILQEFQQEVALQMIPDLATGAVYVEFNMMEKLRGSFEEQAAQLQSSVGAPFLTRNEARARANLPSVPGGDDLVVPLNVLVGGQASPTDSAPPAVAGGELAGPGPRVKARPASTYVEKCRAELAGFFERQGRVVKSKLGAKADWWDAGRWNKELSDLLLSLGLLVTEAVAAKALEGLGVDPAEYDADRTFEWLRAKANGNAESINATTREQVAGALADGGDVGDVFAKAAESRAPVAAAGLATALAGFASVEAVKQVRGTREATKTWLVTSDNPRAAHAAMDGETVGIDDVFSNGAKWPGDSSALDADDLAGCRCDVLIEFKG